MGGKIMLIELLISLLCLVGFYQCQDTNCDFYRQIFDGQTDYVYNKEFPNDFKAGVTCRWQITSPANTRCNLNCIYVNIMQSTNCQQDRFLVSKTGDPVLTGAEKHCGYETFSVTSTSNKISIALITTTFSPGGRFLCQISTIPSLTTTPPKTKSGMKKQMRIVGGQETLINEYPMMVGLRDIIKNIIFCGGTIIGEKWIVTSSHCFDGQTTANIAVVYGEHDITKKDETQFTGEVEVERFESNGDIGLIETKTAIPFSSAVGPACLPFKQDNKKFVNKEVDALGWGTLSFDGQSSDTLQKVKLNVISNSVCSDTFKRFPTNPVNDGIMCTYALGKDTCQKDFGGPLLYQDHKSGLLCVVGVILEGNGCGYIYPGLNSRITNYLPWISSITGIVE